MTKIQDIVKVIQEALENHPEFGTLTPLIVDPSDFQPTLGLIIKSDERTRLGYTIKISDIVKVNLKDDE